MNPKVEDETTSLRSSPLQDNGRWGVASVQLPLLLWLLTLLIWLPWLGNLPLRDWDEALVAGVSRSTSAQPAWDWLLAVKNSEAIYLNKPPGLHWLIGASIKRFGDDEWAVRLMPSLLASLAVPLIVILRRQLSNGSGTERSALCSGLILMTLLPMARHGRLAMLDGTLVSCSLLLISSWLSSKRWPWHGLLAGLGGSGILLLKPPALIGYLAMVGIISLLDRPSSRKSSALGWAISGLIPGAIWHLWHFGQRGSDALVMWGGQGFGRVTEVVGDNSGAWVMPLTEVLEGGWPWILLLPSGVYWAWHHRKTSTGLWELGLLAGSALMVLPLRTQLPWYSHLLWPPIALLCGETLAGLLKEGRPHWIPQAWQWIGFVLLISTSVLVGMNSSAALPFPAFVAAGLGLIIGGLKLSKPLQLHRQQGLAIVVTGWSIGLLTLWQSPLWLWELNEIWDPRPVAAQIRLLPTDAVVILDGSTRPSLNWYAKRPLKELNSKPPKEFWLVSEQSREGCRNMLIDPKATDWRLWHCFSSDQP